MKNKKFDFKDYIRQRFFPHIWCPGCGHGIVLSSLLRAVHELGLNKNEIVITSGIGCSSRISGYVDFHSLHTIHGRALSFATGVKLSKPDLKAIVPMGDGDALAIGGNHFIQAGSFLPCQVVENKLQQHPIQLLTESLMWLILQKVQEQHLLQDPQFFMPMNARISLKKVSIIKVFPLWKS
jgi:hypothetical protein